MGRKTSLKPHWFQILLALADRDQHGLAIMKEVLDRTGGEMHLWPGMLYGALKQLASRGWVCECEPPADAESGGGRPRYYRITDEGRSVLVAEVRRLEGYVEAARAKLLVEG